MHPRSWRHIMEYRRLGKTEFDISAISLGTWQVGGRWGEKFDDALAERIIESAIERGVNFIDTADVYSDRASEAAVGRVVRRVKVRHGDRVYVATKCGRFINPHLDAGYTPEVLRSYVEASLKTVSYTHLRAHETRHDLVCRLLLEKKKQKKHEND